MLGVIILFLVSVLTFSSVDLCWLMQRYYAKVQNQYYVVKKSTGDNFLYQSERRAKKLVGIYEDSRVTPHGLEDLVATDVDIRRDNCAQIVYQICRTLAVQCNTSDFMEVWGWALATASASYSTLDSRDYRVQNGYLRILGTGYADLSRIPSGSNVSGCLLNQMVRRGQYYYRNIARFYNCDDFYLDLNNLKIVTVGDPCNFADFLRYKNL